MDILQYTEEIRLAYKNSDYSRVEALEKEYGDCAVTYKELETAYANLLSIVAGFVTVVENVDQIHHDILVKILQEKGIITDDELSELGRIETDLKNALEKED